MPHLWGMHGLRQAQEKPRYALLSSPLGPDPWAWIRNYGYSCDPWSQPARPPLSLPPRPAHGASGGGNEGREELRCPGPAVVGQGKAPNVFTFSFLSFWWPSRPAVTPLRFAGPRECLHYITPDTTAPLKHTRALAHAQTHTPAHAPLTCMLSHSHTYTGSHPELATLFCLRREVSAAPTNGHSFSGNLPTSLSSSQRCPEPGGVGPGLPGAPVGSLRLWCQSRWWTTTG